MRIGDIVRYTRKDKTKQNRQHSSQPFVELLPSCSPAAKSFPPFDESLCSLTPTWHSRRLSQNSHNDSSIWKILGKWDGIQSFFVEQEVTLARSQVVALINAIAKLLESVRQVRKLTYWQQKEATLHATINPLLWVVLLLQLLLQPEYGSQRCSSPPCRDFD